MDRRRQLRQRDGRGGALEGYPNPGIFLELYVDTEHGTDEDAFGVLHHTGRKALYSIRRLAN